MYCIVLFNELYLQRYSNTNLMEKADSTIAQMRKGVLEMCVVAAISSREAYASDILDRLKQSQLIGPPRKYYSITPEGTVFLSELRSGWDELVTAVSALVVGKNQSESSETPNTL
jgi:PadR family transcriptional regulator, regulatory protein PadR